MIEYKYEAYENIWLNTGKDETDVMHEYCHSVQESLLGPIVIPFYFVFGY